MRRVRKRSRLWWLGLLVLTAAVLGALDLVRKSREMQQPYTLEEVPEWQVVKVEGQRWTLASVEEPWRRTEAWLEHPEARLRCDTVILLGGALEGAELLRGSEDYARAANTFILTHPLQQFITEQRWTSWSAWDWWQLPENLRREFSQNLGALRALVQASGASAGPEPRFSGKVVVGGGSLGAPFAAMASALFPEPVDGIMLAYAFTNYPVVIRAELYRQGLIHFKVPSPQTTTLQELQALGVRILARVLGEVFGNMLKYGQIELYLAIDPSTPVLFVNGRNDKLAPPEAYRPMWEAVSGPKEEVWLEGDHIDPSDAQKMRTLVEKMHRWTASRQLRQCQPAPETANTVSRP
jgi:hypothetical protein